MDGRTSTQEYVHAPVNYLDAGGAKPVAYAYDPPPNVPRRSGLYAPRTVQIRNARPFADSLSLDVEGFRLVDAPSTFAAFADGDAIKTHYYPEVEAIVRRETGAVRVVVFDHNLRHGGVGADSSGPLREPVKRAHNDYTARSGWQRARDILSADEAAHFLKHRFAVINVWRPIAEPVLDAPLAVCDARSIDAADLISSELRYQDRIGETYALAFNPAHRWHFFPRMRRHEVLLIKCFDSAEDGRARFAAHAAFDDPTAPPDAPPRESIEARTYAFFAPHT